MKKFLFICLLFCTIFISGCDQNYKYIKNNLAEVRHNIFVGESDNFKVTFMSGKREKDYSINGYNTDLIDFGVITITIKDPSLNTTNSNIAITINTLRYEEELEKNPFDGTLVADIKVLIDNSVDTISVKICIDKLNEDITLNNICSNWKVNHLDALKIAYTQLSKDLQPHISTQFLGEIYIKIIEDTLSNNGNYLWYVNFVTRTGNQYSVIIDPISKEILAQKN